MVDQRAGALASSRTSHQARLDQHRCVRLAPNELDATPLAPQGLLTGDNGRVHAARGWRVLQAPQLLAAACDLKKPERLMALFRVMPGCVLVPAA
jgi:hypothetical protein